MTIDRLQAHHDGQGMLEYALILVLVAIAVYGTLALLGDPVNALFQSVINAFPG